MAKNEQDDAGDGAAGKKGSKTRLIILAGILLLLVGAGVTFYLLYDWGDEKPKTATVKKAAPVFANLENFTVNLADREHYLQIGITFEVTGAATTDAIKAHMPILRSKILLLLSSKSADDLAPAEGKKKLADEVLAIARAVVPVEDPNAAIAAVHFLSLVIQ